MEITYDYYRIFYYVAKYESFTKAAEALGANQPNITKFIANLEGQLGCKLFARSSRGASLTPEGQILYSHVSVAYEQLKTAELELAQNSGLHGGSVTVSISETALHGMVLPILKDFRNKYPDIRLRILNHSTPQALQALKSGQADFAVVTSPIEIHKPLKQTSLKNFREIILGSSRYNALKGKPHSLAEIAQYPLICLGKDTATYAFYNEFFLENGLSLTPDTEAATSDQLLPMIKCDIGIGFVPENFATEALKKREVFEIKIKEKIPERFICLVEDTSYPLSIAANTLKKALLAHKTVL